MMKQHSKIMFGLVKSINRIKSIYNIISIALGLLLIFVSPVYAWANLLINLSRHRDLLSFVLINNCSSIWIGIQGVLFFVGLVISIICILDVVIKYITTPFMKNYEDAKKQLTRK